MSICGDVSFQEYLEAKLPVDNQSLHKPTALQFYERISRDGAATVIDLGTGTGGMIRRMIQQIPDGTYRFIGVDSDPTSLQVAQIETARLMENLGYAVELKDDTIHGSKPGAGTAGNDGPQPSVRSGTAGTLSPELTVQFVQGDLLGGSVRKRILAERPDAITAHALLDTLPLPETIGLIHDALNPGGVLYATITYDGLTEFRPQYSNRHLEQHLIEIYDRSMDDRRVAGKPTGGSRGGTHVLQELNRRGFNVLSTGDSDWFLSPASGRYPDGAKTVLLALLGMICREMNRQCSVPDPPIEPENVAEWYRDRAARVERAELTAVVHHLDVLAERV